jgi:S1-C subfamily serine protease
MAILLETFAPLKSGDVKTSVESSEPPPSQPPLAGLRRAAAAVAPCLVAVEVERTWPPERLPRESWDEYRRRLNGWDKLPPLERRKQFAAFAARARTLDVNQLLRRPSGPATGLVVSADGFVLTSSFTVGDDTTYVAKATGQPRRFTADESAEKLMADPEGGFVEKPNAIRGVMVVLPDGSRREAKVHARHEPLGIALLKIEASGLPWFDLAAAATSPQLGDHVAAIGLVAAAAGDVTLNPGIVSAASRNRGYRFQTDALLNYGNSGGPVVDSAGSLLGIATAPIEPDTVMGRIFTLSQLMRWSRAPNSGVGFVARADRIRAVLEELKAGRTFERFPGPFLGVQADESRALGDDVVIGFVAEGSPAGKAGLKKGDVIVAYDGIELGAWRELTERIAAGKPGDSVVLTIRRKQKGPRLVIAGRDVETLEDLERLKKTLTPGETFEGRLVADDVREVKVVLGENK